MKKSLLKRIFSILLILSVIFILVLAILVFTMDKPPVVEINSYLETIGKAKTVNADVYAPEYYKTAEKKYKEVLKEWKLQNNRVFFLRDFAKVKELILDATLKAQEANVSSGANKDTLKLKYLKEVELLKKKLDNYHALYIKLPLNVNTRKNYEFGKLSLEEGLSYYGKGDFMLAIKKLNEGKLKISAADVEVSNHLKDYFSNFPKWRNWADQTIQQSARNNSYALIVDKIKHRAYLYYNGRISKEYEVEFGKNWIGDKLYSGDKATPEGLYKVTKKKAGRNTKYYKALLINYPNEQDKAEFAEKKRKGILSRNSSIGGLIEVHGDGGKGDDWTSGCVAFENKDMDEIFSRMSNGSPVTIVGSLVPLSELLN